MNIQNRENREYTENRGVDENSRAVSFQENKSYIPTISLILYQTILNPIVHKIQKILIYDKFLFYTEDSV